MPDPRFFGKVRPFKVKDLVDWTNVTYRDESGVTKTLSGISDISSGGSDKLCYLATLECDIADSIGACFTNRKLSQHLPKGTVVLLTEEPALAFTNVLQHIYPMNMVNMGISAEGTVSSNIDDSAIIADGCFISPAATIGPNVEIGENCHVGPGTVLGFGVKLGKNCSIGANVSIAFSLIGNNTIIHQGASIGQDGFGYVYDKASSMHSKIPQLGRVIIDNDVEIGANTTIDRGSLNDTVIADGCRIGDLVHIAHNVKIGRRTIIIAQVGISGSCTIGEDVVLAGQVGVADHVVIGSKARIAAKSGVIKDVAEGESVMGYPAKPIKRFWRETVALGRLIRNTNSNSK